MISLALLGCSSNTPADPTTASFVSSLDGLSGRIQKNRVIEDTLAGAVTDFFHDMGDEERIYIAGTRGYTVHGSGFEIISHTEFEFPDTDISKSSLFVQDKLGKLTGFLRLSGAVPGYDEYLSLDGREIWRSTNKISLYTGYGFFDSDDEPDILEVLRNEITAYQSNGKIMWRDNAIGNSAAVVNDANRASVLAATNENLREIDASGAEVKNMSFEGVNYIADLAVPKCECNDFARKVLIPTSEGYTAFGIDGMSNGITYHTPYLSGVTALVAKPDSVKQNILIISGTYLDQGGERFGLAGVHTHLYIFSIDGELLFRDMYKNTRGGALLYLKERATILLGVGNDVYSYTLDQN